MDDDSVPGQMRVAAAGLLSLLDESQRAFAALPFGDEAARRWLEYRPEPRPGACIADFGRTARKAAHRLLSTALSDHAYAQAMGIIALEETLDRFEGWKRGRHSNDYWVSVYGDPAGDAPWSWRFEGHHLSVTMTLEGDRVSPAPVFFGSNPARVGYAGRVVSRPLGPEEDLALALMESLTPAARDEAVVSDEAPADIISARSPSAAAAIEPLGVSSASLAPTARGLLGQLTTLYLDRLTGDLAAQEAARISGGELHLAWQGPVRPAALNYYRIQGEDLLIEYDNTTNANHPHTVLRRPLGDFGGDVLAAHYRDDHR